MISNPYQTHIDQSTGLRVQLDIDPQDKSLLVSIRPVRGTTQTLLSRLISNLCNELRTYDVHAYRSDHDTILSILTEPRDLNADQLHRLEQSSVGRTTTGLVEEIPTGVLDNCRGTGICEDTSSTSSEPNDPPSKVTGRKQRNRKADTEKTESDESKS